MRLRQLMRKPGRWARVGLKWVFKQIDKEESETLKRRKAQWADLEPKEADRQSFKRFWRTNQRRFLAGSRRQRRKDARADWKGRL